MLSLFIFASNFMNTRNILLKFRFDFFFELSKNQYSWFGFHYIETKLNWLDAFRKDEFFLSKIIKAYQYGFLCWEN